jgi:aldehyde:ferredoxin oxidoreductase
MSDRAFHILHMDLETGRGKRQDFSATTETLGGSGLAAALFEHFYQPDQPALSPEQPLIFAIGPLTGYFPLMSKVVCAFVSPYNGQYAESHAGGRLALSMRFAGFDAIVFTGRAKQLSCPVIGGRRIDVVSVHYLSGSDVFSGGKYMRRLAGSGHAGHRSLLRIGPAGENLSPMACINVDSYRHFGRMGSGAVMGAKNLKGVMVLGDGPAGFPNAKEYSKLFKEVYKDLTATDMMKKYHNLGTAENLASLNALSALPWRNLQETTRPEIDGISGERFAEQLLLRQTACAGCPVGCIHVGLLREKFAQDNEYLYRQVSYDYEPIFACGSMLGLARSSDVLSMLETCERQGLDVISAGVALAWATEASDKGLISEQETLVPLSFGDISAYRRAAEHLGGCANEFYENLNRGALAAAGVYGGEDFACVLGQEMAGYATGEVYFVSQALGLRHSHLDAGGYSYDQADHPKDVGKAVDFLVEDERKRCALTSMVACLFARKAYGMERIQECLSVLEMTETAAKLDELARGVQKRRWRMKFGSGFRPEEIKIPKRYREVVTWKGPIDGEYMDDLKEAYAKAVAGLAAEE